MPIRACANGPRTGLCARAALPWVQPAGTCPNSWRDGFARDCPLRHFCRPERRHAKNDRRPPRLESTDQPVDGTEWGHPSPALRGTEVLDLLLEPRNIFLHPRELIVALVELGLEATDPMLRPHKLLVALPELGTQPAGVCRGRSTADYGSDVASATKQ